MAVCSRGLCSQAACTQSRGTVNHVQTYEKSVCDERGPHTGVCGDLRDDAPGAAGRPSKHRRDLVVAVVLRPVGDRRIGEQALEAPVEGGSGRPEARRATSPVPQSRVRVAPAPPSVPVPQSDTRSPRSSRCSHAEAWRTTTDACPPGRRHGRVDRTTTGGPPGLQPRKCGRRRTGRKAR